MKVTLITHTPEPEKTIATAAKLCYASADIDTLMDGLTDEKVDSFLKMLTEIGHESPIEHVTFTFGIEGVSRSLLAQITRHRIASFSVQSQRYVEENKFEFVTPPEIADNEEASRLYIEQMSSAIDSYNKLADILKKKHYDAFIAAGNDEKTAKRKAQKKAIEDARFVLPNACATKMIVTMNARSLMNFFSLRCCNRAQWEIHQLADEMLKLCVEAAPTLFAKAGPSCVATGRCGEGSMACGKFKEVIEKYKALKGQG
ncbi:MAG: FAD-dependent thymidylate synthase [Ruminococcus sp.]|nr:FAD-dependent thymidylate synthase [Ruminococcus sp.]